MNGAGGLLPDNDSGWPGLGNSARDVGMSLAAKGPSAPVPPGMKPFGTICPNPLLVETPVSPKIQKSCPLGRGALNPTSRPTDVEGFSYCDRTGEGVAVAGDAPAGDETVIESADATSITTALAERTRVAQRCNPLLPTTEPPHGEAVF
jgi:hypothetical protein